MIISNTPLKHLHRSFFKFWSKTMPSLSPKSFFKERHTISSRTSSFLILTLILFFAIIVFLIPFRKLSCLSTAPTGGPNVIVDNRHKVVAFVGIQTGFNSFGRRQSLRKTWFPSDPNGHKRLEEATGLAFRFIIGRINDESKMAALKREIAEYDDFIQLDIEDEYTKLSYKTLAFFKVSYALFNAQFYVKLDDDIYIRPDRLSLLLAKERSHLQTYIGCMKKGDVFTDPEHRWYEPLFNLTGNEYFLYASGAIYALSAEVVSNLVAFRNNSLRMFNNEDVTIGAWMLAMNVKHENIPELCAPECTSTSIAVWDIPKCSGLCNPEQRMLELHQMDSCIQSTTMSSNE